VNYLAHLYLTEQTAEGRIGSFLGDFVKGNACHQYPPAIWRAIILHRQIDSFADGHYSFRNSKNRLSRRYGLYRGIMVDMFYDHFLACTWRDFNSKPLEQFANHFYSELELHRDLLPDKLKTLLPRIKERNWLYSYKKISSIEIALSKLSDRLKRENPLGEGIGELHKNYKGLEEDFFQFIYDAKKHADLLLSKTPDHS